MGFWSKLKDKLAKNSNDEADKLPQQDQEEKVAEISSAQQMVKPKKEVEVISAKPAKKLVENKPRATTKKIKDSDLLETSILDKVTKLQPNNLLAETETKPSVVIKKAEIGTVETEVNKQETLKSISTKKTLVAEKKRLARKQKEAAKKEKAEKLLAKSALGFSKDIKKLSKKYKKMDEDFFEELEDVLIKTDMGIKMVLKISNAVRKKVKNINDAETFKEILVEEIYEIYKDGKKQEELNFVENRVNVFMVIGVNGTGKTTSLSKIANFYAEQNKKVLIAAADTFRAGAIEQLEEWVEKRLDNKVDLIKGKKQNQDPASVVFDAIEKAHQENYDLLLIDTAGRLQNKVNLMKELEKMYQIVHKYDKKAPHELLLVIDATTGQNGVVQAKEFNDVANVTGIVLTKMDGTSKGGIALAIKDELNIPVKLVGIGEQVEDIVKFDAEQYVYGLAVGFMEFDEEDEE